MNHLGERVWTAQADAWQAEGRLRASRGGGAIELDGVRLMASGLPHPQWNNGDVTDTSRFALDAVRAWYAARADGAGVPWGVHVPATRAFTHGQRLFRKRCMGLDRTEFRSVGAPDGVRFQAARGADLDRVARIDAAAFGNPVESNRLWLEPHLDAPGFTVALAVLNDEAIGAANAILTDDRAGRSVGIFGVAVLERARRRGIGGALTAWLLERAFEQGATFAHLNPDSDGAARIYARLGFEETAGLDVYTDL